MLKQIVAVSRFALATIPQRRGSSITTIIGIAGVVAVMIGVLSIGKGFKKTMEASGDPAIAMVLRGGSDSEMMSILPRPDTRIIADTEGIAQGNNGPLQSAELFVIINLPKRATGTDANVPIRGVETKAFEVRANFRILEGRAFNWGTNEVIVGAAAAREFAGLEVGSAIQMGPNKWSVVGIFSDSGGISDSEIWTDAAVLQPAYRRGDSFQSVYVRLPTSADFDDFAAKLEADPRLDVKVIRQVDYYAEQAGALSSLIMVLGVVIALLMAVGAIFGAINTMYTAVSTRTREIATLRALGFTAMPITISVLLESTVLALIGGSLGATISYVAMDGYQAATLNWATFSQVAFAFAVDGPLIAAGLALAIAIGLVGGFFPAWQASHMPIAAALRES